jgi:ATP-binding cassette subfamily B protein
VAILGENGSGKSTLAKLAARLYDPGSGCISIGGIDLREIRLKDLRSEIGYLPEHPVLFDDTLAGNLRMGKPSASLAELCRVAEIAELTEVLARLPKGWEEPLGPNGSRLSNGERQRVAVARALLVETRILILDEATSCLDPAAEVRLLERLDRLFERTTLILISHRPSAIAWAERVLLMKRGEIGEGHRTAGSTDLGADRSFPSRYI